MEKLGILNGNVRYERRETLNQPLENRVVCRIGIHLTDVGYPDQTTDFSTLSPAELEMAQWVQQWYMEEGMGVNLVMATKPQTLAYALDDSRIGLAAWIVGYASSGLKGKAEFHTRFPADEVLTNVMIYWVTKTIHTAMRTYYVNAHMVGKALEQSKSVPAAVAHCPYDPPLPREWAARQVDLVHFVVDFRPPGENLRQKRGKVPCCRRQGWRSRNYCVSPVNEA